MWNAMRPMSSPLRRFSITLPQTAQVDNRRFADLVISPDGRQVVYHGIGQLYVRSLDSLTARPILGTEGADRESFFSLDGEWIVFVAGGKLKKVSLEGGAPIILCDVDLQEGGDWGSENTILYAAGEGPSGGLFRVSANGGKSERLTAPDLEKREVDYQQPKLLPGDKAVLFAVRLVGDSYQTSVLSLEQRLGAMERALIIPLFFPLPWQSS